jgi:hypothetical protein
MPLGAGSGFGGVGVGVRVDVDVVVDVFGSSGRDLGCGVDGVRVTNFGVATSGARGVAMASALAGIWSAAAIAVDVASGGLAGSGVFALAGIALLTATGGGAAGMSRARGVSSSSPEGVDQNRDHSPTSKRASRTPSNPKTGTRKRRGRAPCPR